MRIEALDEYKDARKWRNWTITKRGRIKENHLGEYGGLVGVN